MRLIFIFLSIFLFANDRALYIQKYKNESKTALIIGNNSYKKFAPLQNSINDARDMKTVLSKLGFYIFYLENGNKKEMKTIMNRFVDRLKRGGVGLFYYSGHGLEIDGKNYLIPVNADIHEKIDAEFEGVDVDYLIQKLDKAGNRLNIIILDACRNDPFSRGVGGGLAPINNAKGMYIAFATAPGEVASDGDDRNGLFTKYLIKYIQTPNLTLDEVFNKVRESVYQQSNKKQLPWSNSSIIGNFYFQLNNKEITYNTPNNTPKIDNSTNKTDKTDSYDFDFLDKTPNYKEDVELFDYLYHRPPPPKKPPLRNRKIELIISAYNRDFLFIKAKRKIVKKVSPKIESILESFVALSGIGDIDFIKTTKRDILKYILKTSRLQQTWFRDGKMYGRFVFNQINIKIIKRIVESHIQTKYRWWNDYKKYKKFNILKRVVYQELKEQK
jgi:hypothetical protein